MFKTITGNTVSEVIKLANTLKITKEQFVQLIPLDGVYTLIYFKS